MKKVWMLLLALLVLNMLGGCKSNVGVIGGADGPTSILVSD